MRALALFPLLFLGACGDSPDVEARNASVAEVGEQIRDATKGDSFIRAGEWVSNISIDAINAPGMPAEAVAQMKQAIGGQSYTTCLTEEEAKRPSEDFFTGTDDQCRYDHFTMGNGKIEAKMRCNRGGVEQVMALDGRYSPESYEMRMATSMAGMPGADSDVGMAMRVQAQRVGECKAKPS